MNDLLEILDKGLYSVAKYVPPANTKAGNIGSNPNFGTNVRVCSCTSGGEYAVKHVKLNKGGRTPAVWITKCFFREVFNQVLCSSKVVLPLATFGMTLESSTTASLVLVTPYMPDLSAHRYLSVHRNSKLSPLAKSRILFSMLAGIHFLHRLSIHHRDIKLDNYVIGREAESERLDDGTVCAFLMDLGLSRARDPPTSSNALKNTQRLGSPGYEAPEIRSGNFGFPSDIFAYGKCLWSFMEDHPVTRNPEPSSKRGRPEWAELHDLMHRCTLQEPSQRPTAQEIFADYLEGKYKFPGLTDPHQLANLASFVRRVSENLKRREEELRARRSLQSEFCSPAFVMEMMKSKSHEFVSSLRKNARKGITDARVVLAVMYHRGIGVDRDDAAALYYLTRLEGEEAASLVGEIQNSETDYARGCVLEAAGRIAKVARQDEAMGMFEEAAQRYLEGARGGSRECVTQLGKMMVRNGAADRGVALLILGRRMGDVKAAYTLGKYYEFEDEKAEAEFRWAADRGHTAAQWRLGCLAKKREIEELYHP
jgi:serine/threonine protein kinase